MRYVGLDVHLRRSSFCILDEDGKIVKQEQVVGNHAAVITRLGREPGPMSICYEASCGYGYLYDRLSKLAGQVSVAHPGRLRLIYGDKKKHDRVDAKKLATLLYLDVVPLVHVPSEDVRAWRMLVEYRQKLARKRATVKSQIRALLRTQGVECRRRPWARQSRAELAALPMPAGVQVSLDLMLQELADLGPKLKRAEAQLGSIAREDARVPLLRTIPGVGPRTAEAFCAYVDRVERFRRTSEVGSYFGLVPCEDSSAGRSRLGHITRDGPSTMRKLLCEAAWVAIRRDATLRAYYQRICRDDPDRKKIALVATAHHLTRVMAAMLRSGEVWRSDAALGMNGGRPSAGG